jgi:2-amino-4-hydroxy-6-hydroxymethyldihydropteridine diphosphokinase
MRTGIALGSNLGDRYARLTHAVEALRKIHEQGDFLVSSFHETEPDNCPPKSPKFLNAVLELETSLEPQALLGRLQSLEREAGRSEKHGFHTPRTLDLDILYYGTTILDTPGLQLPHPRMTERPFVMTPLAEIRPDLIPRKEFVSC